MVYLNIKSNIIKREEISIPVARAIITISIRGFLLHVTFFSFGAIVINIMDN